jgi:Zn-dependent protease
MNSFADHLIIFLMFIPILGIHEAAHAGAAHLLGDDTARDEGRLTLNPLAHLDVWGTLVIPALSLFVFSGALIGWGRPVPVTGSNFRNWRRDEVLVALAGPFANFLLTLAAVGVAVLLGPASTFRPLCVTFAYVSAFLGVLHLIPIPPFDGWTVAKTLFNFPSEWLERAGIWSMIVVLVIFNFTPLFFYLGLAAQFTVNTCAALFGGAA